MKLEGTKTEINLLTAFAGESQARNRYTFDASIAKKEGYVQVSEVFKETAGHEKEHAERLFKLLKEGGATPELKIEAGFPTGPLGGTEENLRGAAAGEKYEFTEMYPGFAEVAEKEDFSKIATVFRMIAKAETWHHDRFIELADNIAKGRVFKREKKIKWRCQNCGFIHEGEEPPEKCPACDHAKSYFLVHQAVF